MKPEKFYFRANLVFILLFLNLWDLLINKILFNGMVMGVFMFGPTAFLWLFGSIRSAAVVTLISIAEFMVMLVFVGEGVELGGTALNFKSVFFAPFFVWAGVNGYWGLKRYYDFKEKKGR